MVTTTFVSYEGNFLSITLQPNLRSERLFVLPREIYLFFIFILTGHISALAGRIFVILVSFDRVSLQFLDSIQRSGRYILFFYYTASKREKNLLASFSTPVTSDWPLSRNGAIFRSLEINLICTYDWTVTP